MPYDIGDALKRIENILLGSIRRNMLRHVGEERREGFDWTMWQTEQLASIRRWSAANLQRHAKDFTRINNAAISLLQQSAVSAETQAEQTLLQTGIQKADEFFDIPDAKLDALLIATRQDLSTAEHALLRKADDVYRKAVFDANVYLQSGAGTMKDAVEMAVEDMRAKGIRAVMYRNGAQVEASSYARMALRTANVRARMAGEGRARDKAGIHTVLVPPSGIACRRCAPWMGRVLVDDVYCSGTAQEAAELGVPLLSEAIRQGFLHPQCNCSPHMFLPGISKMPEVTDDDRDEAVRRYDLTQRQRYNERQIRKWKAIERDAPDARTREKAAARRRSWQQANKSLCDENPGILRRDYEREKLYDLPDKPIVPEVIEKAEEPGEKAGERVRPGQSRTFADRPGQSRTFADRPGQSETFGDARAEMPEQEVITIPAPDGHSQSDRPVTIDNIAVAEAPNKGYYDVLDEYIKNATPGEGVITRDVDLFEKTHADEIAFADWLLATLGGRIHIYQEHTGVKCPDYLWNGKLWDLKTVTTEKAAKDAIRSGHKQIKMDPGGVILNYAEHEISMDLLEKEIHDKMKWYKNITIDIMIVQAGRLMRVIRYKK